MTRSEQTGFVARNYRIFFRSGNFCYLLIPAMIYLAYFYAYPLLQMISRSLLDPDFTLKHYYAFFQLPSYTRIMLNTFAIAISTTLLSLLLGYPIAYLLTTVSERVSQILMVFIIIPFWISILVRSYAWMILLGRNGIVNQALMQLGLTGSPIPLMHNRFGVYVGMLNVLLPFMVFPLFSVMKGIDKNLVKSAQILGAPPWKSFLKVFFPLSLPGVAGGGLLVFILALGFFITPALLGGPKDTMIALLIQVQVEEMLNWGFAAALGTILLVNALIVFFVYNRYLGIEKMMVR
jgi:ABC-type spermidine/putrescine transport system permease subunit I